MKGKAGEKALTEHKSSKIAYLYASFAVVLWSTVASAFKISLRYVNYVQLLMVASVVSTLVLGLAVLLGRRTDDLKRSTTKDLLNSMVMGAINPMLYYLALFKAYSLLPAQIALPLNYTWPIMLVILSAVVLRQRMSTKSLVAITISFVGVWMTSSKGKLTGLSVFDPIGVALALISALFWASYWILNLKDRRPLTVKLFTNFCFGTTFVLIFALLAGELRAIPIYGLLGGIYVGLFEMGVTFLIWLKALSLSESTAKVGNLIYLTPFMSLFVIHIVLGEKIFLSTAVGLALIIAGIFVQTVSHAGTS